MLTEDDSPQRPWMAWTESTGHFATGCAAEWRSLTVPPCPGCSQAAELGAALGWHQVTHSRCLCQISTRNREKVSVPWTPGSSPAVDHHRLSNRREARPRSVIWTYVHLDDFCQQFPSIRTLIPFLLFQPAWLTQLDMPQNLQRTPLDVSSQSASNGTLLTHLNVK